MAEVEIRIPKELDLSEEQINRLRESFDKQLADTVGGSRGEAAAKSKSDESRVEARAVSKSKTEIV